MTVTQETTTPDQAFRYLVKHKMLRGKPRAILAHLVKRGPGTSGEIIRVVAGARANVNMWRARFTELAARGLIAERGQRVCTVSGRPSIIWAATSRTKPMQIRSARVVSARAWRDIAKRMAAHLRSVDNPDARQILVDLDKLK